MPTSPWLTHMVVMALMMVSKAPVAEDTICPSHAIGIHEIVGGLSKQYIAVAKAVPLSNDEGSYIMAEAEARLEARRALMKYLDPMVNKTKFHGLVDVRTCRTESDVYATVILDEANLLRAKKLQDLMHDSFSSNPTPIQ